MNRRLLLVVVSTLAVAVGLAACDDTADLASPSGSLVPPSLSVTPDATLAARFPSTIDGHPVTVILTGRFADVMSQLGAPDATITSVTQSLGAVGIDFSTLTVGFATATVDGAAVRLQALRTPNADAGAIARNYAVVADAFGSAFGSSEDADPSVTQSAAAGKPISVVAYSDGNRTVLYVSGDSMFILDNTTDSQTAKILGAFP